MDRKQFNGYAAPDVSVDEITMAKTFLASGDMTFSSRNGFEDTEESDYVW